MDKGSIYNTQSLLGQLMIVNSYLGEGIIFSNSKVSLGLGRKKIVKGNYLFCLLSKI